MGRQLTHGIIRGGAQTVLQTNQYDQAGRLYAEISGSAAVEETLRAVANTASPWDSTTSGVAGNTRYTVFDERGNIVRTRNESKVEKTYEFDVNNRKILEQDGLGNTQTWQYRSDVGYEQLVSRKDLGGRIFSLKFNLFGQVSAEQTVVSNASVDRFYFYYSNGLIKRISDVKASESKISNYIYKMADERSSDYQYDITGNRVRTIDSGLVYIERLAQDGSIIRDTHQAPSTETRYRFDEQGRLTELYVPNDGMYATGVSDSSGAYKEYEGARVDEMTYRYDEVGNRRQVLLNTVTSNEKQSQVNYWYAYDVNDQVRVIDGYINTNGKIVAGQINGVNQGTALTYDKVGRRSGAEQWLDTFSDTKSGAVVGNKFSEKIYQYNDFGQLTVIRQRFNARVGGDTSGSRTNIVHYSSSSQVPQTEYAEGSQVETLLNTYDARGNKTAEIENDDKGVKRSRAAYRYRGDGLAHEQTTYQYNASRQVYDKLQTTYFNEKGMLDTAGRQVNYRYVMFKTSKDGVNTYSYRGNYVKTFAAFDSYKEATTTASWVNKSGTAGTSTLTYSDRGELLQTQMTGGTAFTRFYASNREGQVIMRHQSGKNDSDTYLYFRGAVLAHLGVPNKPELMDTYTPISSVYPTATPSGYVVNEGDTLEGIAQMVWGDSRMWYLIADANGLDGSELLVTGDKLIVPNVVTSTHNDNMTFKPFSSFDAIGITTPSPKPPKPKCNAMASIVMTVVAVVATVLTAGAAAAAIGAVTGASGLFAVGSAALLGGSAGGISMGFGTAFAASIIGGAVGSAASQLTGMAFGVLDKFSWRQVAVGGLTAGATAGVGGFLSAAQPGSWAEVASAALQRKDFVGHSLKGVFSYGTSQAVGRVAGMDTSFSWRDLAASAVGSAAAGTVGNTSVFEGLTELTRSTITGQLGAFASAKIKDQWFGGRSVNYGQVAADAFGNALGNYVVDIMKPVATAPEVVKKTDLSEDLEKLGIIGKQAYEVAAMLNDKTIRVQMADKLKGMDQLAKFAVAYQGNLMAEASYLDFESTDKAMQLKVAEMQKALNAFEIERVSSQMLGQQGVTKSLDDPESGFHADLFYKKQQGSYTLAFRGTEPVWNDIRTDLVNALGFATRQYDQASKLAVELSQHETFGTGLSFTGHSLGGGLATMAAAATRLGANTFNAASIHENVIRMLGGSTTGLDQRVSAYHLQGDIVSDLQDNPLLDLLGGALTPVKWLGNALTGSPTLNLGAVPEAAGQRIGLTGWLTDGPAASLGSQLFNAFGLHSNQTLLHSFYHRFQLVGGGQ